MAYWLKVLAAVPDALSLFSPYMVKGENPYLLETYMVKGENLLLQVVL